MSQLYSLCRKFYEKIFPQGRWYYWKDLTYFNNLGPILDIGCGHGLFIERSPDRIIGLDLNPNSIAICKRKGLNVIQGTCFCLPFEDSSIGGVYCSHLIEHLNLQDALRLVKEIDRVLRVGGRLVVKTPLPNPHFYDDPTHVKPYPPPAVIHLFGKRDGQDTLSIEVCGKYKVISISYDRGLLYEPLVTPSSNPKKFFVELILRAAAMFFAQFGIRRFKKVAYTIVLGKVGQQNLH